MTSEDITFGWQRVWAIFEETIALPPGARHAFVEGAVAGDGKLRAAVERMLEADERASPLLDRPVARPPAALTPEAGPVQPLPSDPETAHETLGPYRLVRQIGRGGMSTVYLAVREDDEFNRNVVVKVVRRDMESDFLRQRLRVERQILAGLTHPHIARLYDGGSTADGRPYFVMEYVAGLPVDQHCRENRLAVAERLILFRKICDAVSYAHQNLVIHRDLKPSNILATPEGEPRLLDFGIAKLLNPELSGEGLELTATWQRALTPSYASPEQIRGQRTTTASDVYSLGVVLYQLLTGSLPFDFTGRSPSEIERLITETEPTRPSLAIQRTDSAATGDHAFSGGRQSSESPERLRQTLAGDLDAIVLKALRSIPRERYASVEQLSADIERYIRGLPVLARQGTWRYHSAKFLRRNRAAVVASSLIAFLLVGFALSMSWQAAETARERDQARTERDMKQQVVLLVEEIFTASNPYVLPGAELTVREAVERSVPLLDARLEDQPAVRAELLHTSAKILSAVGHNRAAKAQLREALHLRQSLLDEGHPDLVETVDALAGALANLGELEEAEALARQTLDWVRADPKVDESQQLGPLIRLASVLCVRSELEGSERVALEALALAQSIPGSELQQNLSHEYLGIVESARGAYDRAAMHHRQAVDGHRTFWGAKHPHLINPLSNLGVALRRSGDLQGAEAIYNELIEVQRFNFGDDFVDSVTLGNLAGLQVAMGDYQAAEDLYVQTLKAMSGPDSHPGAILHDELNLANTRVLGGKAAEAEADLKRIIIRASRRLGADHWRVAQAESILGASLSAQGRTEEGEVLLVGGLERMARVAKERYVHDSFDRLRRHLESLGRDAEVATYEAMLDRD